MIRLSCIDLFVTEPKLRLFWCKKNYVLFKPPLSKKILVSTSGHIYSLLQTDSSRDYTGCIRNELINAAVLMRLLFSNMTTKFLKWCIMCSRKISVFMGKSLVYFSPQPFSDSAPSLRLLWRRHCSCHIAFSKKRYMYIYAV